MKAKQKKRSAVSSTMSVEGMSTRRQEHVGPASGTIDLRQSSEQWNEEGGSKAVHAQGSSHTECMHDDVRTMTSQMKYQAGELIGEYILYRF